MATALELTLAAPAMTALPEAGRKAAAEPATAPMTEMACCAASGSLMEVPVEE